jgi:hypothetical protein
MRPGTGYHDTQHNGTQHNGLTCDTQHNIIQCIYVECRVYFVMLGVSMLNVIMPSVVAAIAEAGRDAQPPQV